MNVIPPSSPVDFDKLPIPEDEPQTPFPAPSEPLQYRAIGIVRGRYEPSEERLTQGKLITGDGVEIDAVLLGRVLSLVRKHLDLSVEHPWVVYPRTRDGGGLHTQIVGVWSLNPNGLKPEKSDDDEEGEDDEDEDEDEGGKSTLLFSTANLEGVDGFFSIRGEVTFQSEQENFILLKIRQQSKKKKPGRAFKLRLEGLLPEDARGKFWDLAVRRTDEALHILDGTLVAVLPKPPAKRRGGPGGRPGGGGGRGGFQRSSRPGEGGGIRPRSADRAGEGGGLIKPERPYRSFDRRSRPE
ncbi:hypothetical protein [Gloeobacter kilaueensis]|uniref:Uncharacterized protein n=1 Tax=Gloeobacter kilaueensis (strain ATCC BAA-2537 / CCAP 1431/1 / ULC 316 / JS1) TaxID=1183438 RepID=U5QLA2_GLOK1|nr:hypothetical protein [Gloeobacter kilaueensis]AGY58440.1 hypothetical protein GKIL_2194 [Gloeobacter kilaueensis JS1]